MGLILAIVIGPPGLARGEAGGRDLYLEAVVNGVSAHLIGAFRQRADGRLAIAPGELGELGIKPDQAAVGHDGLIDLDRLTDVTYRYDAAAQVIRFEVAMSRLFTRVYDARGNSPPDWREVHVQSSPGAVMNYLVFGTTDASARNLASFGNSDSTLSAALDGRVFGPYGVLSQSAILNTASSVTPGSLRLDTTWTYSDPYSLVTYRAGDFISGGLAWTRPIRLGGLQVQRNFALRPDLVTLPAPLLSGSAAVPSTVDVYVNNIRTFSRDVPAGPFEVNNLPVMSGAGIQQLVIRDSLGREMVTNMPFYSSARLLRPGFLDFSGEVGFPRLSYGLTSNDYDGGTIASGSVRYGVTDLLTVEGHVEGGNALQNGGIGVVVPVAHFGIASLAFAGSAAGGDVGGLISASFEFGFRDFTFYTRSQRSFADYMDVAAITPSLPLLNGLPLPAIKPPKAIDQAALTIPLGFNRSAVTLSFVNLRDALDNTHHILGGSYTRPLWRDASFYVTAFNDFAEQKNFGVFAGLTVSLGNGITTSANTSTTRTGTDAGVDAVKSQPLEVGSYGWRLRDREGATTYRAAAASYRAPFARVEAGVEQFLGSQRASAQIEGAVASLGNGVFFTNRIDDAFAVVDVGAPDVDVFFENRPAGKTNANGVAFIPYLRAYQKNSISVDAKNLPVDTDVPRTKESVVPADRSAAVVKFGISTRTRAALVTLKAANGTPVAPGSRGKLDGSEEEFVVGYDGQAYVRGLKDQNTVAVALAGGGACRASFPYDPRPGEQVVIGGIVCQ